MAATSVSGVYTPSRFHNRGLQHDAQYLVPIARASKLLASKSGGLPVRHRSPAGRSDRRTPSDHRFGPWAARRPAARPLGPPTKNGRPTGHASAAAPRRIDGAARRDAGRATRGRRAALPRLAPRRARRAARGYRTALPRRVGAQRLAGADLRPPAPELRAPLPRVPRRPFPSPIRFDLFSDAASSFPLLKPTNALAARRPQGVAYPRRRRRWVATASATPATTCRGAGLGLLAVSPFPDFVIFDG